MFDCLETLYKLGLAKSIPSSVTISREIYLLFKKECSSRERLQNGGNRLREGFTTLGYISPVFGYIVFNQGPSPESNRDLSLCSLQNEDRDSGP